MIEEGMSLSQISKKLFELGHTNRKGNWISTSTLHKILKKLDLKTKNNPCIAIISDKQLEDLRLIIEPMIQEGMSLSQISKKLFELGYSNCFGNVFNVSSMSGILKKTRS